MGGPTHGQVFISYSHADVDYARALKDALKENGYNVWWDEDLAANDAFRIKIGEVIDEAVSVIVVWSDNASQSHWVREEAHSGLMGDKLVATCAPGFNLNNIPYGFRELHTMPVTETEAILHSLARTGVRIKAPEGKLPTAASVPTPVPMAEAGVPQSLIAIAIFIVASMIGFTMIAVASSIGIGWIHWTPQAGAELLTTGVKEVGFFMTPNWSLVVMGLMPMAWTLMFLSLSESRLASVEMVRRRMLVTRDLKPIGLDNPNFVRMQKHIKMFVIGGIAIVSGLAMVLAISDYIQVSGSVYGDAAMVEKLNAIDESGLPLNHPDIERDWSVAALLSTDKPGGINASQNNAFTLTAYVLYVGLGIGSLFSFGLVFMGLGATFMSGVAQNYGLAVIPDIDSDDKRCGFEVVQRFFSYAFAVAFIACLICFFVVIQNAYLRSPDESLMAFLAPDMAAYGNAQSLSMKLDALVGFLFAGSVSSSATQNVYIWIFEFFIIFVFTGGFLALLRQGAENGKSIIFDELRNIGFARLQKLTGKNEEQIGERLSGLKIWPLRHPSLKTSLGGVVLLIFSFVFYKLGMLIMLGMCVLLPLTLWRST